VSATVRYAPEFRILIDGSPVPAVLRSSVTGLSLQSSLEGVDRLELTLANEGLRWLDHALLKLDREVTLTLGYTPEPLTQMFVGEIVGHTASFPSGGTPTMTVVAQDRRHKMQRGNKTRWFAISIPTYGNIPIPDLAIAGVVSAEHSLIPLVDPVGAALAVLIGGASVVVSMDDPKAMQRIIRKQDGQSDYDFLARIALENGWDMVVDHSGPLGGHVLRFMSPLDHLTPDVSLKYGRDLIDFAPRISTVGQIAGVSATIWQPDIKMEFTVSVGWDWDRQSLDISITPGSGMEAGSGSSEPTYTLVDKPVTRADAARTIVGTLLPRLNRRLTASGNVVGDRRIKTGGVVRIEGVGEKFGGLYRVTSVTHSVDTGGWRTSFELRKEIWFGSIPLVEQGAVPIRLSA
jgi:phage protein D